MSGPSNVPPRLSREATQRGEAPTLYSSSSAVTHNAYRERPLQLQQQHGPPPPPQHLPPPRSYPHEPLRAPHGFPGPEEAMPLTPLYTPHQPRGASQPAYQRPHTATSGHNSEGPYPMTSRTPATENQSFSPPKSQRKTKGHVASACVPCKRAHLRADQLATAQRPCSRCLSNGKEDACVDVQHKKRGRPRLRDDRDARYDPLRAPHYPDLSLRRPLSTYAPGGPVAQGSDEMIQRHYVERAPDGSIYSPPPLPAGYPEPVAYLTMGMDFAKASPTFLDAISAVSVTSRKLSDVAAGTEAEKIFGMQNRLLGEQKRREPNYLPPILGLGPAFQGMGFGKEDITRFHLNIQEQLAFVGPDGYARHYPLRIGLGKEGSFFFVVMLLSIPPRYPLPSSAPTRVPAAVPYHGTPGPPEGLGPRAGVGPAFDPVRHRVSESPLNLRSPLSLQNLASQASPAVSPGIASPVSPYGASAGTSRYSGPTEQPPYGPAASGGQLPSFSGRPGQQRFQLPPIRAHSEQRPPAVMGGYGWQRDERSGRVDIGGLIDKPEDDGGKPH
ncbi:hypothetical protein HRG_003783 [Hirsutella rhossiliensis]|uniref:Zn(2)-C6 fungal-type domain-containing protein n=1 Tax=Hirsutella rhossiliensis TaxID=111463 RepID=A0A9P8N359_9HYPO|nr:uncharacterized protein HRG_03783 [Hirsutella rhossiliensis]KAH0965767.1 hypothetical protein HRG_03783 [Hirsutella rhossiliensis]